MTEERQEGDAPVNEEQKDAAPADGEANAGEVPAEAPAPAGDAPKSPGEILAAADPGAALRQHEPRPDEDPAVTPPAESPGRAEETPEETVAAASGEPVTTSADVVDPHVQTEVGLRHPEVTGEVASGALLGYLVEFETEEALMTAAAAVRDAGYSTWDCHTPYPVHGLDAAMGIKPTILPWIVLGGGLTGCMAGLLLQIYTNGIVLPFSLSDWTVIDPFVPSGYPFVTSGKPIFSIPANIPVTFELTILLSAFGAFFGMWGLNQLPRFYHPVFQSERFRRASADRFFISIEARDPLFDPARTRALADALGGSCVEELRGEEA